jgi:plastocyanin
MAGKATGTTRRLRRSLFLPVAVVLLAAMACGPDDESPAAGGVQGESAPATIVGDDTTFDVTELQASAGETLRITFDNRDDGVSHNLHVSGNGVDEQTEITAGPVIQTLEVTFGSSGEYTYVCDVHPQQMEGTITVR